MVEMWFIFAVVWGIGGSLREDGRKKFDPVLRELEGRFPSADSVFEYCIDTKSKSWVTWESKIGSNFKPPANTPFF